MGMRAFTLSILFSFSLFYVASAEADTCSRKVYDKETKTEKFVPYECDYATEKGYAGQGARSSGSGQRAKAPTKNTNSQQGSGVDCNDPFIPNTKYAQGNGQAACVCNAANGEVDDGKGSCKKQDIQSNVQSCLDKYAVLQTDGVSCRCNLTGQIIAATGTATCNNNQDQGEATEPVRNCVAQAIEKSKTCTDAEASTRKKCEAYKEDTINGALSTGQGFAAQLANSFINKKAQEAQQGQQDSSTLCAQTSLLAGAGVTLMDSLKTNCSDDIKSCVNSCSALKGQDLESLCGRSVDANAPTAASDKKYIAAKQKELGEKLEKSTSYCQFDAPKENDMLGEVMKKAGNSQNAATACACQHATDQTGCANGLAAAANAMASCQLGSADYASSICVCMRDSSSPSCAKAAAAAANTMGSDIAPGSSTASNFGTTGSGTAGDFNSDMDLSGMRGPVSSDATKVNNALGIGGEGVGGGMGGGGVSASAGGSGEPGGGAVAGEDHGGIGGAFSSLKSLMGSVFSGGSKNPTTSNSVRSKDGVNFDPSKYQNPRSGIRGLAGGSEFGTRNMDIFKTAQKRYLNDVRSNQFFEPGYK